MGLSPNVRVKMRSRCRWVAMLSCLGALFIFSADADCEPGSGFGLYIGPATVSLLGEIASGDSAVVSRVSEHGVAVGADAQFEINADWSLNPYLQIVATHYQNAGGNTASFKLINGSAGLQVRRWFGDWFFGAQYLYHDTLYSYGGTIEASQWGPAWGLGIGWEGDSHWSAMFQWDALEGQGIQTSLGDTQSEYKLLIGYHWY